MVDFVVVFGVRDNRMGLSWEIFELPMAGTGSAPSNLPGYRDIDHSIALEVGIAVDSGMEEAGVALDSRMG